MRGGFVLGLVVAFLISMAFVIPLQLFDVKAGESRSSDLAAWIQAIGSIAAVAGAAYLPVFHDQKNRRQKIIENITFLKCDMESITQQIKYIIEMHEDHCDAIIPEIYSFYSNEMNDIHQAGINHYKIAVSIRNNIEIINRVINKHNNSLKGVRNENLVTAMNNAINYFQDYINDLEGDE